MKGRKKMQNTIRFGVGLKVGEIPTAVDKETKKVGFTTYYDV